MRPYVPFYKCSPRKSSHDHVLHDGVVGSALPVFPSRLYVGAAGDVTDALKTALTKGNPERLWPTSFNLHNIANINTRIDGLKDTIDVPHHQSTLRLDTAWNHFHIARNQADLSSQIYEIRHVNGLTVRSDVAGCPMRNALHVHSVSLRSSFNIFVQRLFPG